MLAYREVVYDMDITDITSKEGMFRFIQISHKGHNCLHRVHAPFPNNITKPEHQEVALLFNQGSAAMALLSRLTKRLLMGKVPVTTHLLLY